MNKLKNNVIRSIPNLHQEMKIEHGKILSAIKPNEFQEPRTTKYMELDLKNKINLSIRENLTSLYIIHKYQYNIIFYRTSNYIILRIQLQPKKIKKIDGKVATIVELIKQDLLPMLNIQNDRIEKLERRIKVKNESEGDSDLRKSSLISDKKSNSVVESEVQNLSVSVDEIKKNLSHLDIVNNNRMFYNFVKYQFIKGKCQTSEVPENKNKNIISQIQAKLNTEIIQQKIETQQTTKQIQEYITIQLLEIKEWINKIQIEQQKEIEVKLNLMETQFYQFLYQPLEVLRQIQTKQSDVQIKIKEFESIFNSNLFQGQISNSQDIPNCCKQNHNKQAFKINCGHSYHEECLSIQIQQDLKEQRNICCKECHTQIQFNKRCLITISKELQDQIYKEQIKQMMRSSKMDIKHCQKCGFLFIKDQSYQDQEANCVQCIIKYKFIYNLISNQYT